MSEYPISCISCRRKKIKCNKKKPCNQCVKKGVICEFPSKFRNINIQNEHDSNAHSHEMSPMRSSSQSSSNSTSEVSRLHEEVELLRKEKLAVLHENFKLSQKNSELRSKLQTLGRTQNAEHDDEHGIEIAGETTELGEKYYGPSSSNYMIEALRSKKDQNEESVSKSDSSSTPLNNECHPTKKKQDGSESDMDTDGHHGIAFAKKSLPWLIHQDGTHEKNLHVIKKLVGFFFEHSTYRSFISKPLLLEFVDNYDRITDKDWENDDDLLLLHMVLILAVSRLTPKSYNDLRLSDKPVDSIVALHKRCQCLVKNVLYRGFTKLRHNLLNESIMTVQAYILCTEWYFIDQRYEESWSMLFHCCAVAYAIGLHVMVNMRTTNDSLEEAPVKLAAMSGKEDSKDGSADNKVKVEDKDDGLSQEDESGGDIPRFKVWFALKYMCGQLCSVLGRPNPISIQVNSVVLFTSNQESLQKIRLDSEKTQVQLKMGLSECLRLSNMMLIESFMMNFTIQDVMRLDARFKEECEKLKWFVSQEYQASHSSPTDSVDAACHMPLTVEREPAIVDLIILHINRAKLLEPFSNQFLGPEENRYLIEAMCESISRFLDYTVEFCKDFLSRVTPQFLNSEGRALSRTKLGKVFRMDHPFLNSFMYQGIIVIFTLLNYKAKEFVQGESDTFLKHVEQRLNDLLQLSSQLTEQLREDVRLWSTNILYLINKDLQHINTLLKKRKDHHQNNSEKNGDLNNEELDKILGFSFKDPFWLNAENIPYYLSSPSDDEMGPQVMGDPSYDRNMQSAQFGLDVMDQYNMQEQQQYAPAWNQDTGNIPSQQMPHPDQFSQQVPQQQPMPQHQQLSAQHQLQQNQTPQAPHVQFSNVQQPSPMKSRESSQFSVPRPGNFQQMDPKLPPHQQQQHAIHSPLGRMNLGGAMQGNPSGPTQASQGPHLPHQGHHMPIMNSQIEHSGPKGISANPPYNNVLSNPQADGNINQQEEDDEKEAATELNYAQSAQMSNMPQGYYNPPYPGFHGPQ
ncbi:hypothetical protein CJI97_000414 [Candidozyma auris]|nr:hypothetical protein CJI97_000414 [[Candida] auris]